MPIRKLIAVCCLASLIVLPMPAMGEPTESKPGIVGRAVGRVTDEFRLWSRCQVSLGLLGLVTTAAAVGAWRYSVGLEQKHQAIQDAGKDLGGDYPAWRGSAQEKAIAIMDVFLGFDWNEDPAGGKMGEFLRKVQKGEPDSKVRVLAGLLLTKGRGVPDKFPDALRAQLDAIAGHPIPHYQEPSVEGDVQKRLQQVETLAGAEHTPTRDLDLIRVQMIEALERLTGSLRQRDDGYPTPPEILADLRRRNVSISDARFDALFEFLEIEPGEFLMGSPNNEPGKTYEEGARHPVKITRAFALGKTEVTQEMWKEVMGKLPRTIDTLNDKLPVTHVNWYDANHFAAALTLLRRHKGEVYRLPSEAEWEYAARGGQKVGTEQRQWAFSFGKDASLVHEFAAVRKPEDGFNPSLPLAGSHKPNPLGLHDMHGSVWEWCADTYEDSTAIVDDPAYGHPVNLKTGLTRVMRSGSFIVEPERARSASRTGAGPVLRIGGVGIRLTRTKP